MNVEIYNALAPLVTTFAAAQSVPVAYPGITFEPPTTGEWLELLMFWNGNEEYGMAAAGPAVARGFARVLVHSRPGQGINDAAALAEALIDAIPKGTQIGPALVERTPAMTGPITDGARIFHTITFRWFVAQAPDTTRVYVLVGDDPGSHIEAI